MAKVLLEEDVDIIGHVAIVELLSTDFTPPTTWDSAFDSYYSSKWSGCSFEDVKASDLMECGIPRWFVLRCMSYIQSVSEKTNEDGSKVRIITITPP